MTGDPFTEGAKATGELAKFGQKGLDTAEKAGRFAERHFGKSIANIVAISDDWLGYLRAKNFVAVMERYERLLATQGGSKHLCNIPLRQLMPLFEAVTQEDDETLQDIWARYLASGSTDSGVGTLTKSMTDLLKRLEPDDIQIISVIASMNPGKFRSEIDNHEDFEISELTGLDLNAINSSLSRLDYLGLMQYQPGYGTDILLLPTGNGDGGGSSLSVAVGSMLDAFRPTPMFLQFIGSVGIGVSG